MPRTTRPHPEGTARAGAASALRSALFVLLMAGAGVAIGLGWHRLSEPVYTAMARVALEPSAYRQAGDMGDATLLPQLKTRLAGLAGDAVLADVTSDVTGLRNRLVVTSPPADLTADIVVHAPSAEAAARDSNAIATAFARREADELARDRQAGADRARRDLRQVETALASEQARLDRIRTATRPVTARDTGNGNGDDDGDGALATPDLDMSRMQGEVARLDALAERGEGATSSLPESIRTLGERRDAAAAELGLLSRTYGPRHPRRVEATRRLAAAREALRQEAGRLRTERAAAVQELATQRATAAQAATLAPAVPATIEAPASDGPELARLQAELSKARAALAALEQADTPAPVAIVIAAQPPHRADGPSAASFGLMGAAAGILAGLAVLLVLGVVAAARRAARPAELTISDVSYRPVDLASGGRALRLEAPAQFQPKPKPKPGPGLKPERQSLPEPEAGLRPEPGPVANMERSVRALAEAMDAAQAALDAAPAEPAANVPPADPSAINPQADPSAVYPPADPSAVYPPADPSALLRRERLRRELREMAARRHAQPDLGSTARILTPEEIQRRQDEGNGPHRL